MKDILKSKKFLMLAVLLAVAILSVTVVSKYATSAEVHANSIVALDDKKMKAMELTAGVAATSAAISAIPGDAATPIAEQVSELTTPLLIVVCAIYLEKFLLTTIGYISFNILIPLACVLLGVYLFSSKEVLRTLAVKLAVFALAAFMIVPASVKATDLIEQTFETSIAETYDTVDEISGEAEKSAAAKDEGKGFEKFLNSIGEGVSNFAENAKNALSVFIDAIAVLIITTCVIPIAVLLFFVWIVKILFGINIPVPKRKKMIV